MPRLKIKSSLCGPNFNHVPGDVVDWADDDDAARLVEAGFATYEGEPPKRTKASTTETDDAAHGRTRKGGRGKAN